MLRGRAYAGGRFAGMLALGSLGYALRHAHSTFHHASRKRWLMSNITGIWQVTIWIDEILGVGAGCHARPRVAIVEA